MSNCRDETFQERKKWGLIGAPSSAGARRAGQERAPAALRAAGLLDRLRAGGLDVADLGDLPEVAYRPDPEHPRQQNLSLVVAVARQVAGRVERSAAQHRLPLVLGGDCSLSLGVVAGLVRSLPRLGVVYFDADLDLNTPDSTPSGIFDGMVLAHLLGRGVPELTGIGPRCPLLSEPDVVLFGYQLGSGSVDAPELEALERSVLPRYPKARVLEDPVGAAREALGRLEGRCDGILVHFDVDVVDCPAADVPHPDALDPDVAFDALRTFVEARTCAGVVVTELNVDQDPDGAHTQRLVRGLSGALGAERG